MTCRRIVYFSGGSARRRKRKIHPADAIVGAGRVGRGLGKGGGGLLEWTTASCLVEDTMCQTMGNCTIVSAIYPILCGLAYFLPRGPQYSEFRLHSGMGQCCPLATVEPESQACSINVMHSVPRGLILGEMETDKIGEEGRSVCHPSGSGFGSPSTSFGKKTRGTFFRFVQ